MRNLSGNRDFLKDWQEDESSTAESAELITEQEVKLAIKQMKKGKAAGPSGVTAEMLQAAGEAGIRWVTEICNAILKEGKVPEDWERSWIVSVYKGKGDALECGFIQRNKTPGSGNEGDGKSY